MKKGLIFSLIIIFCISCSRTKKEYYQSGELKSEYYKDDNNLKQGEVLKYYKNGIIKSIGYCTNDTFNGIYKEYYSNSQLKIQTMFFKGLQNGEFLEYFDNGQIKQKSNYIDGKENGLFIYYYSNGKPESIINMKNGYTLHYTSYDSLGNIVDKKHSMYIEILSPLNKKDSIKIKERVPGFIASNTTPMFAVIEKYGTIREGEVPKMQFNPIDSAYYITFPPQKDTGKYVIKTFFRLENKYQNENDTIITLK